jgi:cysteine desulfurase family protein (TIGR01976 family)
VTKLDVDWVRTQFPAFSEPTAAGWAHFENAGGSYVPHQVSDILSHFFRATKVQPYVAAGPSQAGGVAMDRAYELIPATFNAERDQINFGPSTTQNTYVLSHAFRSVLTPGDEIIVTNQDHEANIGCWRRLESDDVVLKEWAVNPENGLLDVADLEQLISERTRLVCVTHASNVAAAVNPIRQIADLVHAAGGWLLVDGVAHAPHAAIDLVALGCDAYVYSSYKTFGPHLGMMFTTSEFNAAMANQGHYFNDSKPTSRLVPAGPNHAEVAASAGIVDYYQAVHDHHFDEHASSTAAMIAEVFPLFAAHEESLVAPLLELLASKDVKVVGLAESGHAPRAPTIAFASNRIDSRDVWAGLGDQKIACAHGNFYARRLVEAMGLDPDDGVMRLSLVHYNTMEEVERAVQALDRLL